MISESVMEMNGHDLNVRVRSNYVTYSILALGLIFLLDIHLQWVKQKLLLVLQTVMKSMYWDPWTVLQPRVRPEFECHKNS